MRAEPIASGSAIRFTDRSISDLGGDDVVEINEMWKVKTRPQFFAPLPGLTDAQNGPEARAALPSPTPIKDPNILKQGPYDSIENDIDALVGAKRQMDLAPLGLAIYEVQDALNRYSNSGSSLPPVTSAEFDFKVSTATIAGAKVNIWILAFGGSMESDHVNDVTFTYAQPSGGHATKAITFDPPNVFQKIIDLFKKKKQEPPPAKLTDELLATIQAAAIAAKNDFKINGTTFDKKVTVTIQFGVQLDAQASASIPVYSVVIGPSIERKANVSQSVKIVFGKAGG